MLYINYTSIKIKTKLLREAVHDLAPKTIHIIGVRRQYRDNKSKRRKDRRRPMA